MAHPTDSLTVYTNNSDTNPINSRGAEFWGGVRGELPLLLGVIPFGIIFGALAMQSSQLNQVQAQAMSAIIFGGSAQFIAAQLLKDKATFFVTVLTVFVVNLRHALYSASMAPLVRHLSAGWKAILAYLLTDEAYAVGIARYGRPDSLRTGNHAHWYFLGCGLTLWTSWQLSTTFGVFIGTQVSDEIRSLLEFTLPLTFIAVVVPNLKSVGGVAAALISGLAILVFNTLPFNSGLLVAATVGIAAGFSADSLTRRRTA